MCSLFAKVATFRRENTRQHYGVGVTQILTRNLIAMLNFETVKYFGNEEHEAQRYDRSLQGYEKASVKSQTSLALLNVGQAFIISVGLTAVMLMTGYGIVAGTMTLGAFVLALGLNVWWIPVAGVLGAAIMERLVEQGHVFEHEGATWFRSTDFGDEGVIQKAARNDWRAAAWLLGWPRVPARLAVALAASGLLILLASLAGGWIPLMVRLTHRRMQLAVSLVEDADIAAKLFDRFVSDNAH